MQQTKDRDNQQETLAYLGGLFDGEGHFSVGKVNAGKRFQYKAWIAFSNTDPKLVDFVTDVLDDMNIAYYIRLRAKSSVGKNQYELSINSLDSQRRFLELIIPHLRGLKENEANLVYKYVMNRIDKKDSRIRNNAGRFVGNTTTYDEKDKSFLKEYRKLKAPQRLHVMPLPKALLAKEG